MRHPNFQINFEGRTINRSKSGAVTATIWIRVDDQPFPEESWNDFVVVVLNWWISALVRDLYSSKVATFSFMDGSFSYTLARQPEGTYRLRCVHEKLSSDEIIVEATVEIDQVVSEVVGASGAVLQACKTRGWSSDDIDCLREGYELLSKVLDTH